MKISKFLNDCSGALYDTSRPDYKKFPPLRALHKRHFAVIENSLELRATLRAGGHTFPGGYELAFICADGGLLCFDCARSEYKLLGTPANNAKTWNKDWQVVGCEAVMEAGDCAHCYKNMANYGEDLQ